MAPLLPFALVLGLLSAAALAAGLGFRPLGKALAISTALSPTTGVLAAVAGLLVALRIMVRSPAPGLTLAAVLFNGLLALSLATLALAPALAARRARRDRESYLRPGRPSPAWLAVSAATALAAVGLIYP